MSLFQKPPQSLDDVFAAIPNVNCQRKCADQCTAIPLHRIELERIRSKSLVAIRTIGFRMAPDVVLLERSPDGDCPALFFKRECTVYNERPVICRLYGAVEGLECPHGCKPERLLKREEAHELLEAIHRIGEEEKKEQSA